MKAPAVIAIGIGRIIQLGLVFLTYRLLTDLLPTAEVGLFFLIQALAGFFGLIVVNPVGTFMNREVHGWHDKGVMRFGLRAFFMFAVASSILAAAIIFGISFLGLTNWPSYVGGTELVLAVACMVAGATLSNSFITVLNLFERRFSFVLLSVLSQGCALGVSYFLASHDANFARATIWMIATGCVQIAIGLIAYLRLLRECRSEAKLKLRNPIEIGIASGIESFALPIAFANVAVWGLMQGYRPLVESLSGLDSLAVIGLGMGLAMSMAAAFETLVHQLFLPKFYRGAHSTSVQSRAQSWNFIWQSILPPYLAFAILLAGLAPLFISLLSKNNFSDAAVFLAIGAGAEFARMAGNLLILLTQSERQTRSTLAPYWTGAVVALAGSIWSASTGHMAGVAVSVVTGQTIATICLMMKMFKSSKGFLSFKIPANSVIRFFVVPVVLVFFLKEQTPLVAVSLAASAMGALTVHYWWWMGRNRAPAEKDVS